jgi:hypothetical protein
MLHGLRALHADAAHAPQSASLDASLLFIQLFDIMSISQVAETFSRATARTAISKCPPFVKTTKPATHEIMERYKGSKGGTRLLMPRDDRKQGLHPAWYQRPLYKVQLQAVQQLAIAQPDQGSFVASPFCKQLIIQHSRSALSTGAWVIQQKCALP